MVIWRDRERETLYTLLIVSKTEKRGEVIPKDCFVALSCSLVEGKQEAGIMLVLVMQATNMWRN